MTIRDKDFFDKILANGFIEYTPVFYPFSYREMCWSGYDPRYSMRRFERKSQIMIFDCNICHLKQANKQSYSFLVHHKIWKSNIWYKIPEQFYRFLYTGFIHRKRIPVPEAIKQQVYINCDYICCHCNSTHELEIDHIKPVSWGGNNDIENLQLLCKTCNLKKSNKYEG